MTTTTRPRSHNGTTRVPAPPVATGLRADLDRLLALVLPRGPLYRNAHYLGATVEVDSEAMKRWLPWGVSLAQPARADLFCAWFPDCVFGSVYHEAGLFVHVKTVTGKTGIHCPWMILDDDVALIIGRELLGYPKKLGEISWHHEGDRIAAHATRRGADLVHIEGTLGAVIDDPPPFLGRPHRNAVGTLGLGLPVLTAFTPRERPVEVRQANVSVRIGGSERDPLHEMGLGDVVEARLHRVDIDRANPGSIPIPIRPLLPTFLPRRMNPRVI